MIEAKSPETVTLDLRSGRTVWELDAGPSSPVRPQIGHARADIIVVGAGITGAFIADRLARPDRKLIVLDRHEPQRASTAASTALLQWEIDASMLELEDCLGFETAAAIYRRSVGAVRDIGRLARVLPGDCGFAWRDTLLLAGDTLGPADLREERRLRQRAGIDGDYLAREELAARYGLHRDAALRYGGSAQAHPIDLARLLLDRAITRGARVVSPALVVDYDCGSRDVTVATSEGFEISGDILILANGYEMPPFLRAARHRIASTWVVATGPQPTSALWPGPALVWEASDPYCYLRATADQRIIIGGEDEDIDDPVRRDALTPAKIDALTNKLRGFAPEAELRIDAAWSGFFGETDDGLPLIGAVPGRPRCYAAFGYGGNGITFSAMAAVMLEGLIEGRRDPAEAWFAIDR